VTWLDITLAVECLIIAIGYPMKWLGWLDLTADEQALLDEVRIELSAKR
jgi:hypothetical protein